MEVIGKKAHHLNARFFFFVRLVNFFLMFQLLTKLLIFPKTSLERAKLLSGEALLIGGLVRKE